MRLVLMLVLACTLRVAVSAQTHVLVVTGLPGEPGYAELFERRARTFLQGAQARLGIAREHITWLVSHDTAEPPADGKANRESLLGALADIALHSEPGDRVVVLLIGHGTARDGRALFNLPGPDLSPGDLAAPLQQLAGRRLALVVTSPASAPFITSLAGPDRVLISATGSGAEDRHTLFADPFVQAFDDDAADNDKDGRVSLLEAFNYANHSVAQRYESDARLRTEHALLEDDGDGRGSARPGVDGGDGELARGFYLADTLPPADASAPQTRILEAQARDLLVAVEALRQARVALPADEFMSRLETLLVRLAINRRALRAE